MAKMNRIIPRQIACFAFALLFCAPASAQFLDEFNGPAIDPAWEVYTGDGTATMEFLQGEGYGSIRVDATSDRRGIWWAVIGHRVSSVLDLPKLRQPGYAIRVEARIRVSDAPRRVNLSLNTQRTTDFDKDLMEFDIPDTWNWHTISFTDPELDVRPGDRVTAQLALMDWGLSKYRVDVDYFKVDIVELATAGPDKGVAVPYRPPIADPNSFAEKVPVSQDSVIDLQFPEINFNTWYATDGGTKAPVITVSGTQWAILRWDLSAYAGRQVEGSGLLELTTHSIECAATGKKDFGGVRVTEILGGDPAWDQHTVTLKSLTRGKPVEDVIDTQMIINVEVAEDTLPVTPGSKTLVTISRPVMQRLLDGKTKGIVLRPLGPINATFDALEFEGGRNAARLLFNLRKQ